MISTSYLGHYEKKINKVFVEILNPMWTLTNNSHREPDET